MRSRTIREGSVGLLILLGLGLVGGLIFWVRGFDPSKRSYRFTIEFGNIAGMEEGSPVRYRGVTVGKTTAVQAEANLVAVTVEVKPASLVIPKDVLVQVVQTGLIGETYVDISPKQELPETALTINPLSRSCDSSIVVCNGDRLIGESGISFTELIGSITRFTDLFSNPEIVGEIRTLTRNSANAADGVADLTREVANLSRLVRQELEQLTDATTVTVTSVGQAADNIALTAAQIDALIASNRGALITTLDGISQTTQEIRGVVSSLAPIVDEDGALIQNLELLSDNAVAASANLRTLTDAVGSADNLLLLQQTLDSARTTFQNVEKITSDLDELTGDPTFRENLRNLVNGLSDLTSSTYELQRRTQLAQMLDSAEEVAESSDSPMNQGADRSGPRPADSPQPDATIAPQPSAPANRTSRSLHHRE